MRLYAVHITMPFYHPTYYVLAESFDKAAEMVIAVRGPEHNARIKCIEVVGEAGADVGQENLLLSDAAVAALGLVSP